MSSRYDGKPLLRLVECYILSAIGHLPAPDEARLATMAPKLGALYGVHGTWPEIIAQVMKFPPQAEEEFRKLWRHNSALAAQQNQQLLPEDFAQMVVDQNFNV